MFYGINDPLTWEMLEDSTEGFSPCPTEILNNLATLVEPASYEASLLDNCAGTGQSANFLAKSWGLRLHLIEPNEIRHAECLKYDGAALNTTAQAVSACGYPSVWFFNPPFDISDENGSMEKHILGNSLSYATGCGTFCIWMLHHRFLFDSYFKEIIASNFGKIIFRKFPEPLFSDYQQVIIFGFWGANNKNDSLELSTSNIGEIPELRAHEFRIKLNSHVGSGFYLKQKTLC